MEPYFVQKLGDLITADYKVLSDRCESRNNHRYAVVVQDLATQWIQAYPCKTKTSQETQRSLQKFLEPDRNPKVIYTDSSLEFGKACEDLSWNHCTSTPHQIRNKCDCWESSAQNKGRHLCCIVAIGSWWTLVGRFHGMLHLSAKHSRSLVRWENTVRKTFWETMQRTDYSIRSSQESINLVESFTWIVPRIRIVRGENLEGWHIGCRHWGVGNDGRIRNLLWKTQCKAGDISQRKLKIYFPIADGRIKLPGGDQELRTSTLIRERPIEGDSHVDFLRESEGSLPPPHDSFPDAGEAINDFWSMSGNFVYRHHVEPRVKLYSPRESFPIPLKYIDVSRTTHTNLDVKQEKRIDDFWNVDGSRDLSGPWTGFTRFTLLEEKTPDGYMWSGGRLTNGSLTSRPDHLWTELCIKRGRNAKLKERQKWSNWKTP